MVVFVMARHVLGASLHSLWITIWMVFVGLGLGRCERNSFALTAIEKIVFLLLKMSAQYGARSWRTCVFSVDVMHGAFVRREYLLGKHLHVMEYRRRRGPYS